MSDDRSAVWVLGKPSPAPELTEHPGAGWHPDQGLLLVCDDLSVDDARDFDAGRVHLTVHGPVVALTLQGRTLTIDFLAVARADTDRPTWADPAAIVSSSSRAAFTLALVDHATQLVVGLRMFTISPHLTQAVRREVLQRWSEPLTDHQLFAATMAWREQFPDRNAVRGGAVASSRIGD